MKMVMRNTCAIAAIISWLVAGTSLLLNVGGQKTTSLKINGTVLRLSSEQKEIFFCCLVLFILSVIGLFISRQLDTDQS